MSMNIDFGIVAQYEPVVIPTYSVRITTKHNRRGISVILIGARDVFDINTLHKL